MGCKRSLVRVQSPRPGQLVYTGVVETNPRIKNAAIEIILELFGPDTARQYRTFYEDKTDTIVLTSLDELLHEVVGPQEAQARTASLKNILKGNNKP